MSAKPSRLTKNRHGTYCLRWIVPVGLRSDGSPREIRFSLRTTDPARARILALEFNLALERVRAMTRDKHPHAGVTPLTVTIGQTQWDIRDDNDRRLFDQLMHDNPDIRQALLQSVRSGVAPAEAMAALVQQVKAATVSAASVANPMLLKTAIEVFEQSRGTLDSNRRSTAGEKRRTMDLLQAHLIAHGRPADSTHVHEVRRDELLDFVNAYAQRPAKAGIDAEPSEPNSSGSETSAGGTGGTLSPRTVLKAISHLENFFTFALGKNMVASSPLDNAFYESLEGLRRKAAGAKRNNSYDGFPDSDLRAIFEPVRYLANLRAADDFWTPLMGAYLGMRLAEIVTRKVSDIYLDQEQGVYVVAVRQGKNANSVRHVPIPEPLIRLGLLDYVEHVRALGATALFPHRELNETRKDDPSKHVSRVFGLHLDDVGITAPEKVFHSFRHTVITRLHVHGTPVGDAELIVGHAAQDVHMRLSSASGQFGGKSSTHLKTYVNAGAYGQESLYGRLKAHLENSLHYPLDFGGLREAARIVQELTVKKPDGSFSSGWHTNNRALAQAMLDRVCATASQPNGAVAGKA
ncbi:site-specific integrase [Methylibium rhizosphaerae]|uniref:site-specific integrase n=1 Tax=Methylibium rhizosphaerae TaxID=2570323 RepID=UPI0011295751|nr:site-specific integrase [Methylibium rhizosphaerae]